MSKKNKSKIEDTPGRHTKLIRRQLKRIILLTGLVLIFAVAGCGRTTESAGNAYSTSVPPEIPPLSEAYACDEPLPDVPVLDEYDDEEYTDEAPNALAEFAAYYFAIFQTMWDEDDGEMWGMPLHTPLIIVCRRTSTAAANRPDSAHEFIRYDIGGTAVYVSAFSAYLPGMSMERNEWAGQTGVFIPLGFMQSYDWMSIHGFVDRTDRNLAQLTHYVMHALQPSIMGMHGADQMYVMQALQPVYGRVYYHLEMSALVYAVTVGDRERAAAAIHDALSFRHIRRSAYHTGAAENQMKVIEGTAVYTELRLVFDRNAINGIAQWWQTELLRQPSDIQVALLYGYKGGALYGILLDDFGVDWRSHVDGVNTDLGYMLQSALGITEFIPFDEIYANQYGYNELAARFR